MALGSQSESADAAAHHHSAFARHMVDARRARSEAQSSIVLGPTLRMTHRQRELLTEGLLELKSFFSDPDLWERAAQEAELAQRELGMPNLVAGFTMWTSNIAALAHGAWWMLLPGCGAPAMQSIACENLRTTFLERRPDYARLAAALSMGRYPTLGRIVDHTERVRCMLLHHIRDRHRS